MADSIALAAFAVTLAALVATAVWVHSSGDGRDSTLFVALLGLLAGWTGLTLAGELFAGPDLRVALFYASYAFIWAVPLVFAAFALHYTGHGDWLHRERLLGGLGAYVAAVLLTATDAGHGLVFESVRLSNADPAGVAFVGGPGYVVLLGATYLLLLVGLGLLLRLSLASRRSNRWHPALILGGATVPLLADVASTLGVAEVGVGATRISLSVFAVAVGVALYRHRLFAIAPVARSAILEHIAEGVVVLDDERRIVDYNAAARGYLPALEGSLGEPLGDALPVLLEDGDVAEEVALFEGRARRLLQVQASPITNRGRRRGTVLVLRDVTEQATTSHDLAQQTERLEEFASTVSHDLRNPLNVATAGVELVRESGDVDRLEAVSGALGRMEEIIDDALALAREGRAIEEREPVALAAVAQDAWSMVATGAATIDLEGVRGATVHGDPSRLRTVFENLFRNAVEHGSTSSRPAADDAVEHADPVVTVTVDRRPDGFVVADDGPGVPPEDRERVFERGTSGSDDGTGFGLAIVEAVAAAHGWEVRLEESDDGGAAVVFEGVSFIEDGREATDPGAGAVEGFVHAPVR